MKAQGQILFGLSLFFNPETTTIFYDNGIEIDNNLDENLLNINQKKPGSRIYIINGTLENLTINFFGYS